MQSSLSSPQLTLKGWVDHLRAEAKQGACLYPHSTNKEIGEIYVDNHTHTDSYIRWFIRNTVKGRRVFATIKNFESPLWVKIRDIINAAMLCEAKHADLSTEVKRSDTEGLPALMSWYSKQSQDIKNKIRSEILSLAQCDDDFMIAFDATSLYPSAMWDKDSEFSDIRSARSFKNSEEKEILGLFNTQSFRPKTGFLK